MFYSLLYPQNLGQCLACSRRSVSLCCVLEFLFFLKLINEFIYFWLCWVFVSVRGLSLVVASGGHSSLRCAGLSLSWSCCGAQAPDAQAQQLWLTGPVAPQHVGSSQTRARTRVPCIGRQTLNHCATREALWFLLVEKNRRYCQWFVDYIHN